MIRRRTFPLLIVLVALLPLGQGLSAGMPDWADAIADGAPALPEGLADKPSRTLFSETKVTVANDGRIRVLRRVASQALREAAGDVDLGVFNYQDGAKILRSRAWHLPLEAKKAKKTRGAAALDVTLNDLFLSDSRTRFLHVEDVKRGSLVFFEFEIEETPSELAYLHTFLEDSETRVSRFVLETPESWTVQHAWLRIEGSEPVTESGARVWELRDLAPLESERLGLAAIDRAPILVVGFYPPDDASVSPAALRDWVALANWYEELSRDREKPNESIETLARRLAGEAGDGVLPQVRAAGDHVRDSVRYVAKEVGIGGYQPRHASEVVKTLWGDCKDKSTLLRSILSVMGTDSYPILINASLPDTVAETVPSLNAFNHLIVGVPVPEAVKIPLAYRAALVKHDELGRLLIVDTTDETLSVGSLSSSLSGKTGLVVAGDRSALLLLPAADSAAHGVERRMEVDVGDNGSAEVRLVTTSRGQHAADARAGYKISSRKYREWVEDTIEQVWPTGSIDSIEIVAENELGEFAQTVSISLPAPESASGADQFLGLFPWALDDLPQVSLRRRKVPVRYGHARTLQFETVVRGAAAHALPTPARKEHSGDGWSIQAEWEQVGDTVRGSWNLELSRLLFEVDGFDNLKELWKAARRTSQTALAR